METFKQDHHSTLIGKRNQNRSIYPDSPAVISKNVNRTTYKKRQEHLTHVSRSQNLELLLSAIVYYFNQVLEDDFGSPPLDSGIEINSGSSSSVISDRIVSLTTDAFNTYFDLHPELSEQEALDRYMNMLYSSIDIAFSDIREMLENCHQLDEDTLSVLDEVNDKLTYKYSEYIQSFGFGYDEFNNTSGGYDSDLPRHYLWSHELLSH